jgi:hypothetical protein
MNRHAQIVLTALAFAAFSASARAQGPVSPAGDLAGRWTLDVDLSDNPGQVAAAIKADFGRPAGDGFGFQGEGRGRGEMAPREREKREGQDKKSPEQALANEDQKRLNEITDEILYAPLSLSISASDSSVTIANPQGETRTFQINGKSDKQPFGSGTALIAARIEGPRLVTEFDLGNGRKLVCTYSLAPTTKQLVVRTTVEPRPDQPGPFEIKRVYNRAGS